MEEVVNVVAVMKIKPEFIEESRPVAEKLIESTRKEEGNIRYDWFRDINQKGAAVALECFKSLQAFQAHAVSEHIQENIAKFKAWTDGQTLVRVLKPFNVDPNSSEEGQDPIHIVAVLKAKEGTMAAAEVDIAKMAELTRKETGNLKYDWYLDSKEVGVFVVLETYTNMQEFESHATGQNLKNFLENYKTWKSAQLQFRVLKPEYVAKK